MELQKELVELLVDLQLNDTHGLPNKHNSIEECENTGFDLGSGSDQFSTCPRSITVTQMPTKKTLP